MLDLTTNASRQLSLHVKISSLVLRHKLSNWHINCMSTCAFILSLEHLGQSKYVGSIYWNSVLYFCGWTPFFHSHSLTPHKIYFTVTIMLSILSSQPLDQCFAQSYPVYTLQELYYFRYLCLSTCLSNKLLLCLQYWSCENPTSYWELYGSQ